MPAAEITGWMQAKSGSGQAGSSATIIERAAYRQGGKDGQGSWMISKRYGEQPRHPSADEADGCQADGAGQIGSVTIRQDPSTSSDRGRAAEMILLHRNATAAVANIFHGGQFIFADVLGFDFGSTAKTAFFLIRARVAQMPRRIGNGTAILTGVGHGHLPFVSVIESNDIDLISVRLQCLGASPGHADDPFRLTSPSGCFPSTTGLPKHASFIHGNMRPERRLSNGRRHQRSVTGLDQRRPESPATIFSLSGQLQAPNERSDGDHCGNGKRSSFIDISGSFRNMQHFR